MLNLSDIRKKAREGKKKPKAKDRPAPTQEPKDALQEGVEAPPERQAPEPSLEPAPPAPVSPAPSAASKPSAGAATGALPQPSPSPAPSDPLEALFSLGSQLTLATEEAYFAGLAGASDEVHEDQRQFLSFSLGEEEYMVDIRQVREIIKVREITDIPRAPYFILGIISLRGNIIPVYDLKKRLKLGTVEPSADNRIVVCQEEGRIVGLLVEKINEVVRLFDRQIETTPAMLTGLDRDLVEGVGRHEGRMMILLDLSNVLDAELF